MFLEMWLRMGQHTGAVSPLLGGAAGKGLLQLSLEGGMAGGGQCNQRPWGHVQVLGQKPQF